MFDRGNVLNFEAKRSWVPHFAIQTLLVSCTFVSRQTYKQC